MIMDLQKLIVNPEGVSWVCRRYHPFVLEEKEVK